MLTLKEPYDQISDLDKSVLRKLCDYISFGSVKILEVGCWTGDSTTVFAQCAKDNNGMVVCVDTFKGTEGTFLPEFAQKNNVKELFSENMRSLGFQDNVVIVNKDSTFAHNDFPDNYFDLIFIDGDHRYSQVKKDIDNYFPKLKSGGIFSGHDLDRQLCNMEFDITEGLEQDMYKGYHCGVTKAVWDRFGKVKNEGRVWWLVK